MAQSVLVYPVQDGSLISSLSNDNKNEPTQETRIPNMSFFILGGIFSY